MKRRLRTVLVSPLIWGCAGPTGAGVDEEPLPEHIVAALLRSSGAELESLPECEGVAASASARLSDDIAYYLSEMNTGANQVEAACWPPEGESRTCTVTLNHDAGELVWTRGYRFEWKDGEADHIRCFTIP